MKIRHITQRQAFLAFLAFFLGNTVILGASEAAGSAGWICAILAAILAPPLFLAVASLAKNNPGASFFDVVYKGLGKVGGAVTTVAMVCFSLYSVARDISLFSMFASGNVMHKASPFVIALVFSVAAILSVRGGTGTVARWIEISLSAALLMFSLTFVFSARGFEPGAVIASVKAPPEKFVFGTLDFLASAVTGALATTVFMFGTSPKIKKGRIVAAAVLTAGAILAFVFMWDVALLGANAYELFNFPTFHAMRAVDSGGFLDRLEILLLFPLTVFGFFSATVHLLFITSGVGRLFSAADSRFLSAPTGILAGFLGLLLFKNQTELAAADDRLTFAIIAVAAGIPVVVFLFLRLRRKS